MDVETGHVKAQATTPGTSVVVVQTARPDAAGCECTPGWVLFGVGWAFPLCWIVGVFLPLCTKNRQDRRAAIGSGVMVVVYGVVLGLVLGLLVMPMVSAAQSALVNANALSAALNSQLALAAGAAAALNGTAAATP